MSKQSTIGGKQPNEGSKLDTVVMEASKKGLGVHLLERQERVKKFRKEASRMVSKANKRIKRLEDNGLQNSPAYQGYLARGGQKFSIAGKSYREVQQEVAKMKRFIDSQTSTIRGVNKYLRDMANDTGIKYSNLKDLRTKADGFFRLAARVEEYLRTVEDMASAIGYQKIWESINTYVETNQADLSQADNRIDEMVDQVTKAILEHEKPELVIANGGNASNPDTAAWFQLPKE